MLDIKDLCVSYGKKEVLKGASVSISRGELVSLIGANGCGKSTLMKSALGIVPKDGGTVEADGVRLCSAGVESARRIAYLPQGREVPDMTVEELTLHGRFPYLSYPRRYGEEDRKIAREAMEKTGAIEYAESSLLSLSGGMRQCAYLAMALAQSTDYILLDEPTTYLDIKHQVHFARLLRRLCAEGRGILAVMHDLPMAFNISDKIAVMENGRIVKFGTPDEVFSSECIARIFGVTLFKGENGFGYAPSILRQQKLN